MLMRGAVIRHGCLLLLEEVVSDVKEGREKHRRDPLLFHQDITRGYFQVCERQA